MICEHEHVRHGTHYDYCEDCGATRRIDVPGRQRDEWHTCALCRTVPLKEMGVLEPKEAGHG